MFFCVSVLRIADHGHTMPGMSKAKTVNKTLGERIREARLGAGYTRARDLSVELDVSESRISRWENDHVMPRADTIAEIARVCHVTTDYLLGVSR